VRLKFEELAEGRGQRLRPWRIQILPSRKKAHRKLRESTAAVRSTEENRSGPSNSSRPGGAPEEAHRRGGFEPSDLRRNPVAVRSRESCAGFKPEGAEEEPGGDIGILASSSFHKVENRDLESLEIPRKDLNR
jgi:hypothetical protein